MQEDKEYLEEQLHDSDHEDHEEEGHPQEDDYSSLEQQELFARLKTLYESGNATGNRSLFEKIYAVYQEHAREQFNAGLEKYLAEGGVKEDYAGVKTEYDSQVEELNKLFHRRIHEERKQREAEHQKNLDLRLSLIEELKSLIDQPGDPTRQFEEWHDIQHRWRQAGVIPPASRAEVYNNYRHYNNLFFSQVQLSREFRELDLKKNAEIKQHLCEEAEALTAENEIGKSLRQYRLLQQRWRETGPVPKEDKEILWARFKAAGDKLAERRESAIAENEKQKEQNLELKKQLVEKIAVLSSTQVKNLKEVNNLIASSDALFDEWKKIGYVPDSDKGNTWKAFRGYRNQIFRTKDAFFAKRREEFNQNLKVKTGLCEEAEALQHSTDWAETTKKFRALQEAWKKSGPVSRRHSDKIWTRFRKACDTFFNARSAEREGAEKELEAHAKVRESIIAEAENLQLPDNASDALAEIEKLRDKWDEAGMVPRNRKQELNRAFNQTLRKKIAAVKEKHREQPEIYYKLHYEELKGSPEGENKLYRERRALLDKIRKLEGEIIQLENNLGFFGTSRSASSLVEEYEQKLEAEKKQLEDLKKQLRHLPV